MEDMPTPHRTFQCNAVWRFFGCSSLKPPTEGDLRVAISTPDKPVGPVRFPRQCSRPNPHGFPSATLMLVFPCGSTGDVKTPWNSSTCEHAAVVAVVQRGREAGLGGLLSRAVGAVATVSLSLLHRQSHVAANVHSCMFTLVAVFIARTSRSGAKVRPGHGLGLRGCLRKFAEDLVWENWVRVEATKLLSDTKAFRWF